MLYLNRQILGLGAPKTINTTLTAQTTTLDASANTLTNNVTSSSDMITTDSSSKSTNLAQTTSTTSRRLLIFGITFCFTSQIKSNQTEQKNRSRSAHSDCTENNHY